MQHAQGLGALGSTGLIAGLCVPCVSPFLLVVGRKRAQDGPHALVNQSAIATLHGDAEVSAFAERTRKNLIQIEKGIHQRCTFKSLSKISKSWTQRVVDNARRSIGARLCAVVNPCGNA
jgi:nicotinate-nucleotide pyrophosphorylase